MSESRRRKRRKIEKKKKHPKKLKQIHLEIHSIFDERTKRIYFNKGECLIESRRIKYVLQGISSGKLRSLYVKRIGGKCNLSKAVLVNYFTDLYNGKKTDIQTRKEERRNIDDDYISETTRFFKLSDISVPRVVVLEILSFLQSDKIISSIGCVNSSFYLLILTNWSEIVPITIKSIYKSSILILKSMKSIILYPGLFTNEFKYLCDNMSPSRIHEIIFNQSCTISYMERFMKYLEKRKVVLKSCRTLVFPKMFNERKERSKMFVINGSTFPNIRTIKHFQPKNMNIKQLKHVDKIQFGDHFRYTEYFSYIQLTSAEDFFLVSLFSFFSRNKFPTKRYKEVGIGWRWGRRVNHEPYLILPKYLEDHTHEKFLDVSKLRFRFNTENSFLNFQTVMEYIRPNQIRSLKVYVLGVKRLNVTQSVKIHPPEKYLFPQNQNQLKELVFEQVSDFGNHRLDFQNLHYLRDNSIILSSVTRLIYLNVPVEITDDSILAFPSLQYYQVEYTSISQIRNLAYFKNLFIENLILRPSKVIPRLLFKVSNIHLELKYVHGFLSFQYLPRKIKNKRVRIETRQYLKRKEMWKTTNKDFEVDYRVLEFSRWKRQKRIRSKTSSPSNEFPNKDLRQRTEESEFTDFIASSVIKRLEWTLNSKISENFKIYRFESKVNKRINKVLKKMLEVTFLKNKYDFQFGEGENGIYLITMSIK